MECSFETRKRELEQECVVESGMFLEVRERIAEFMKRFSASLSRRQQRDHATKVVYGLCSDLDRKNAESIAYHFGMDRKAIQHFIGESQWADEPLRIELRNQIASELGCVDGVLVFDPSSFPKSGNESVGVTRQWCGRLGKVENCQVGVYLAYVSAKGHALVDCELYLPKSWTQNKTRLKKAGVPRHKQRYRMRREICMELLLQHGDQLPHQWITADDELGQSTEFRRELREIQEQYLLAVPCNTHICDLEVALPDYQGQGRPRIRPHLRIDRWAAEQPEEFWQRIDVRDAEKGPLIVEVLKRRVATGKRGAGGPAEETCVVIRYRDRDRGIVKQDYYLSNAPESTSESEFARVAKAEHRVEECFDRGKGEAGMADYEVRNWTGWQHHQTLSQLASWFLNVETRRAEKKDARNYVQSSSRLDCIHPPRRTGMRFTPRRKATSRATIIA